MRKSMAAARSDLAALLCSTIARACRREPTCVTVESNLLDLGLDSLTLVSVITQIEAACGLELSTDETLVLLEAVDIRALVNGVATIIASQGGVDSEV